MSQIQRKILIYGLKVILEPVIRYCIRNCLKFQDFLEVAKACFIGVAKEELETSAAAVNHSRLSVMTGMHRRDVMKFKEWHLEKDEGKNLILKVVGQWQTNQRFITKKGRPKILSYGTNSEFSDLVFSISQDLNPTTVLFELERVGSVVKTKDKVKLVTETFVPKGDVTAGLNILNQDVEDLIGAVENNLFQTPALPNLHLRTVYDRVRANASEELKLWLLKEGHAFQIKARDHIAKFDQDVNPDPSYEGKFDKVVLGTFSNVKRGRKI